MKSSRKEQCLHLFQRVEAPGRKRWKARCCADPASSGAGAGGGSQRCGGSASSSSDLAAFSAGWRSSQNSKSKYTLLWPKCSNPKSACLLPSFVPRIVRFLFLFHHWQKRMLASGDMRKPRLIRGSEQILANFSKCMRLSSEFAESFSRKH